MESNFTNGTNTSLSEIDYQRFLDEAIPATIFLMVLSVVGTIGNIHTIIVYMISPVMAKYSVRVFIIWLAITDLTACLFCMPFELIDIRYNYTWSSDSACKFFKFLNHVVTGASASLLTTIAIERYKLFVKNLPRLFASLERTNVISAVLVGFSVISSIPAAIFYGSNDKETNIFGLIGKDCSFSSEYQNMRNAGVYYSILAIIGLVCIVMCIVSYGRILREICTRKQWRKSLKKKTVPSLNSTSDIRSETTQVISTIQNEEVKINNMQIEICKKANKKSTRSSHNLGNAIRLTVSLMIATAVSYVGNLLYVFTLMVRMLNPKIYHTHIRPVSFILVRAYFINNAINPIVFCLLDSTFRQECLKLYGNICSKKNISTA